MVGSVPFYEEAPESSLTLSATRHSEKAAICKPGRDPSPEPNHAGTSSLQNNEKINFFCLSHPVYVVLL